MTEQLRYADGPTTEVSRVIAASPGDLWVYVADINLPARYSSEFHGAEWLDGATEPVPGSAGRTSIPSSAAGKSSEPSSSTSPRE